MSRTGLGRESGLSAAAITNVVAELLADGLVIEHEPGRGGSVGRPASNIALNDRGAHVLAVQIGAGTLQVAVADLGANLLAERHLQFPARREAASVVADAAELLRDAMTSSGVTPEQVLGIGVGAAGVVDRDQRVNVVSINAGWENIPIAELLEAALDLPTVVDHNVRAMAAAEARYGAGKEAESFLQIYARTGIGIGLILDSRPYRGGSIGSHEIGHMPVAGNTLLCTCGRHGCLETIVADAPVRERLQALGLIGEEDDWPQRWNDLLDQGDVAAFKVVEDLVAALAPAIVSTSELLNPQLVVLGGLLADIGDHLVGPLEARVRELIVPWSRDHVHIQITDHGDRSGLVGAATVALDHFLFGSPLVMPRKANQT